MSDRQRLFVAFEVPGDILEVLYRALEALRTSNTDIRWTRIEALHVTLKFLGSVPSDLRDDVQNLVAEVATGHASAPVALSDLGAFPNVKRARVLWAGVEDAAGLTPALATNLDRACETVGIEPESRAYAPHLTLGRLRRPRALEDLPQVPSEGRRSFEVEEMVLFRSHLGPEGARYEVIRRFPLG